MPLDPVQILCEMVAIPSVNPMGRAVSGDEYLEYRMTDYLQQTFERLGLRWQRQPIEPRRDNIIARLEGDVPPEQGGPLYMFDAHQDTVPVDGMTIEPWNPIIRDGRVQGRGSCDIKGGMAAMLSALSRLAEDRPRGMPTIIMCCTVNEELGCTGATDVVRLWSEPGSLMPRRPDGIIVAEPTNLNVVVAHKGPLRWRIHTRGRAAHSSQPHLGENAVYKMARVVTALEAYARTVGERAPVHPLCGGATLSVGTIRGGLSVNTVPDRCTIEIDRRLLPGEDAVAEQQTIIAYIEQVTGLSSQGEHADLEHDNFFCGRSLSDDNNGPLGDQLLGVVKSLYGTGEKIGVPYGTNAGAFNAAGAPCVVFGPGSIDQAHTADEWLSIEELQKASEALYQFGRSF